MQGIARGFHAPETACYECTMSEVDWQVINKRRSCSMLARRALAHGGVPTTPITASIIGAIQAQEVVKYLHDLPALFGRGFVYEGATHNSYGVSYRIDPDCAWHDGAPPIERLEDCGSDTPLANVWSRAEAVLGGCDAIDFGREVVESLQCIECAASRPILRAVDSVSEDEARCEKCGADSAPQFLHSVGRDSAYLARTPRQLGLPQWEIVWARFGERFHGFELAADAPQAMGGH
jgi:adenylyltransferase/sulfurtransferase